MGINEVSGTQERTLSYTGYADSLRPVKPKIDVGAALLKKDGQQIVAGTIGVGADIKVDDGLTISPEIKGYYGENNIFGGRAEVNVNQNLGSQWQVSAGIGADATKFKSNKSTITNEYMEGNVNVAVPSALQKDGDFYSHVTEQTTNQTRSSQIDIYGTAGVTYKPNDKLSFTAGVELGSRTVKDEKTHIERHSEGMIRTPSTEYHTDPTTGQYIETKGESYNVPLTSNYKFDSENKSNGFIARAKVGANYNITDQWGVSIRAGIPLNKKADPLLEAGVSFRF